MSTETKKATVKKEAAAKPVAKKAVAKKPVKKAAKKSDMKVKVTLEFHGNSFTPEDLVKNAKNVYRYDMKKKVSDIQSLELYAKPEEGRVYFVVNGKDFGSYLL